MKQLLAIFALICMPVGCLHAQRVEETNAAVHFKTVDIFVDSKREILAAYQLEWTSQSGNAKIVGIEGGENPAFRDPPYYDPKAIQQERVILAAFSTAKPQSLPKGRTRVATIHLQVSGSDALETSVKNARAAAPNETQIEVIATSLERKIE